ncbi:MAG: putative F420-0 ABC transporter substrate-binding protein [Propionibacteriaceae bacterium]
MVRLPVPARVSGLVAALCLVSLAACTDAGADPAATPPAGAAMVEVDNCGTQVTVEQPPERVLAIKSTSIEMMLALGLSSSMIGTAFSDGPVPAEYADAATDVPVVSETVPGREALLDLDPDFVYAGWESNLTDQGVGERSDLSELGIQTLVSPAACKGEEYQPHPLTFDDVEAEIRLVGDIFGVPHRAEELITDQQDRLAAATERAQSYTGGKKVLWYSSGSEAPYVGAGIGAPAMIMESLGLENVYGDVEDTWTAGSWEAVLDAEPDLIVLVDASWNTAESKKELLATGPAAALPAVAEERYLTVRFPASEAGVANVEAVESLADQLAALE